MNRTPQQSRRQGGPVEGTRPELPYAQVPICLLRLPTGERAAAIEVWVTLHHYLRLGASEQRITDEMLSQSPCLVGRSLEHARKGLEVLDRLGLIVRRAKGSSRRVAIVGRLRGGRGIATPKAVHSYANPPARPIASDISTYTPTAEEIALMKRFFPKRCEGLLVPRN